MIPVWLTPRTLKIGGAVAVLLLVVFAGWKAADWRSDAARERKERVAAENRLEIVRAALKASQKAAEDYHEQIETIRNRPVSNAPVRLCRRASVSGGDSAGGTDATAPADGVVPAGDGSDLGEGTDIRPDINELMRRVEEEMAKLRALQGLH